MRNLLALIISISLHLIILYFIINVEISIEKEVKEKFEIKIVKKEKISNHSKASEFIEPTLKSSEKTPIKPDSKNYIDPILSTPLPEIDTSQAFGRTISTSVKKDNYLHSLESLIVKPQIEMPELDNSSKMTINWTGEGRKSKGVNSIDFSTFPKETFTGVDLSVEFSVSSTGKVYNSYIVPPGSGSVEFDILVLEYVDSFTFEDGEETSGVINIIYE